MSQVDYFAPGDWNALCADCGRKAKASELVKNWKGFYVHPWHVDVTRHPQDFVRGIPDNQAVPWSQPPPEDAFIAFCSLEGNSSVCDHAEADCAICDQDLAPGFVEG